MSKKILPLVLLFVATFCLSRTNGQTITDFFAEQNLSFPAISEIPKTTFYDHRGQVYYTDSVILNSKWDTLKHLYSYDQNHRLVADHVLHPSANGWENQQKTVYLYNSDGNLLSSETKTWDGNFWQFDKRIVRHFNDLGEYDSSKRQLWQNEKWVNWLLETRTFDDEGMLDMVQHFTAEEGEWVNNMRLYYDWYETGLFKEGYFQKWTDSCWVNETKDMLTYDDYGNQLSYLRMNWTDSVWENHYLTSYTRDGAGKLIKEVHQTWQGEWKNSFQDLYQYGLYGNIAENVSQQWVSDRWQNTSKYTYSFDSNGDQTERLFQKWTEDEWRNFSRSLITYDNYGNRTLDNYYVWHDSLWQENVKTEFAYDYEAGKILGQCFAFAGTGWIPESGSLKIVLFDQEIYKDPGYSIELYYGEYTSGMEENSEMPEKLFTVFPNPASDWIYLKIGPLSMPEDLRIKISDQSGRTVKSCQIKPINRNRINVVRLNVQDLFPGMYIVQLTFSAVKNSRKLIISK